MMPTTLTKTYLYMPGITPFNATRWMDVAWLKEHVTQDNYKDFIEPGTNYTILGNLVSYILYQDLDLEQFNETFNYLQSVGATTADLCGLETTYEAKHQLRMLEQIYTFFGGHFVPTWDMPDDAISPTIYPQVAEATTLAGLPSALDPSRDLLDPFGGTGASM